MPTFDTGNVKDGELHINIEPIAGKISQPALRFLVQQIQKVIIESGYANVTVVVKQAPPAEIDANGKLAFRVGSANSSGLKGPVIEVRTLDGLYQGDYTISMTATGFMARIPPPNRLFKKIASAQVRRKGQAAIGPELGSRPFNNSLDYDGSQSSVFSEGVNASQRPGFSQHLDDSQESNVPYNMNGLQRGGGPRDFNTSQRFDDQNGFGAPRGTVRSQGLGQQQVGLQQANLAPANPTAPRNFGRPQVAPLLPKKPSAGDSLGQQAAFGPPGTERFQPRPTRPNAGSLRGVGPAPIATQPTRPAATTNVPTQNTAKRALVPANTSTTQNFRPSPGNAQVPDNRRQPQGGLFPPSSSQAQPPAGQRQPLLGPRQVPAGQRPVPGGARPAQGGQGQLSGGQRPMAVGQRPVVGGQRPIAGGQRQVSGGQGQHATGQRQFSGTQRQFPNSYNELQASSGRAPGEQPGNSGKKTKREKSGGGSPGPTSGFDQPAISKAEKKKVLDEVRKREKEEKQKEKERQRKEEARQKEEAKDRKKAAKEYKNQKSQPNGYGATNGPYVEKSGFWPEKKEKKHWWSG